MPFRWPGLAVASFDTNGSFLILASEYNVLYVKTKQKMLQSVNLHYSVCLYIYIYIYLILCEY